jgi:hypothetical protein
MSALVHWHPPVPLDHPRREFDLPELLVDRERGLSCD